MALIGNQGSAGIRILESAHSNVYSLSATLLRRRITGALQATTSEKAKAGIASIDQNTVYTYPTVDRLTDYLVRLATDTKIDNVKSHVDQIETMVSQYSKPWPTIHGIAEPGTTVLLTGSTGNLGSHILEALLRDPRILLIYAFNRSSSHQPLDRHISRFENNGLDKALLTSEKLTFLEGDASQDNLGVESSVFNQVCIIYFNVLRCKNPSDVISAPKLCRCRYPLRLEA
jgi:hypothetical protein